MKLSPIALDGVTVIIPSYNRAKYIGHSVTSALNQGLVASEVIVVDDGSTDETLAVLSGIEDPRLRVITQPQSGPAAARNAGLKQARGQWIQFLDSDDALVAGILDKLVALGGKHPGAIPFGQSSVHSDNLDTPAVFTSTFAQKSGFLINELCFYLQGTIFSCLFAREVMEAIDGFSIHTTAHYCEDYDFALQIALLYPFVYLPEVTYKIGMHRTNRHRDVQRKMFESRIECVEQRLAARPEYWLLKRRTKACFCGLVADIDLRHRQYRSAVLGYLRCLAWYPVKLGAWKGLLNCLIQWLKKPPSNPGLA